MPSTVVEVRNQYSPDQEVKIIEAVQSALVESFKIPPDDRCVRIVAHEPHRFIFPPNKSKPELYTLVTVSAFLGRSIEAKRNLYQSIVRR